MTAPTDHITAAQIALADAGGTHGVPTLRDALLARAQIHAILALVEETRTANLLTALDHKVGSVDVDPHYYRNEIIKRLWPTP